MPQPDAYTQRRTDECQTLLLHIFEARNELAREEDRVSGIMNDLREAEIDSIINRALAVAGIAVSPVLGKLSIAKSALGTAKGLVRSIRAGRRVDIGKIDISLSKIGEVIAIIAGITPIIVNIDLALKNNRKRSNLKNEVQALRNRLSNLQRRLSGLNQIYRQKGCSKYL